MIRRLTKLLIGIGLAALATSVAMDVSGHDRDVELPAALDKLVDQDSSPTIETAPEPEPPPQSPSPEPEIAAEPPPPPEPAPPPQPKPVAPTLKIVVSAKKVEVGVHIEISYELGGGPVREFAIEWDPEPPPLACAPHPQDRTNPNRMLFAAPTGVYSLKVLAIGEQAGFARDEVLLEVFNPTPPAPVAQSTAKTSAETPEDKIRAWAQEVRSQNLQGDAIAVGKAAKKTAQQVRSGEVRPEGAVAKWKTNALLELGSAARLSPWDRSPDGDAFFDFVRDLFTQVKAEDVPQVLDKMDAILEGK